MAHPVSASRSPFEVLSLEGTARIDERVSLNGLCLFIARAHPEANLRVRFGSRSAPQIPCVEGMVFRGASFTHIYVTTSVVNEPLENLSVDPVVLVACAEDSDAVWGQRGWFDSVGRQVVSSQLADSAGVGVVAGSAGADAIAPVSALSVIPFNHLFNGASWDRQRGNVSAVLFALAARTATNSSADQVNHNARGVIIHITVTAIVATPSVVFTIRGKDPIAGSYYGILTSAAVVGISNLQLVVYPGLVAAANIAASNVLPRIWRLEAAHGDADSITYSVNADLIL